MAFTKKNKTTVLPLGTKPSVERALEADRTFRFLSPLPHPCTHAHTVHHNHTTKRRSHLWFQSAKIDSVSFWNMLALLALAAVANPPLLGWSNQDG
jgi:hypothetical protein